MSGQSMDLEGLETGLFIDGAWRRTGRPLAVLDKYRQTICWTMEEAGEAEIRAAIDAADAAHRAGAPDPNRRSEILLRAAELVASRRELLRRLMAREAGFTASDADGEVTRSVETLKLAAMAAKTLTGQMVPMDAAPGAQGRIGFTIRVPVGPVAAITPFNSPINTVTHKVAPAFAAGNPVILKPSAATPATASVLIRCLGEAGVPPGFLGLLHGGAEVAQTLIADERVRFITFTGSTAVGRQIQAAAGLRPTQLELGNISSTVVAADADLDQAMAKIVAASFRKAGQVCSSIQLLHVERPILEDFLGRLVAGARKLVVGDPEAPGTEVGPLVSEAAAIRVESWVAEAVAGGARLHCGGVRRGTSIEPTVLTDVGPEMRVRCEEIFGPVVSVIPFDRFEEAVERVNASPYGLAAGVFTRDLANVRKAMFGLQVGGIHINETSSSRVDLMPYGGVKQSGHGKEGPFHAIREMTEERLVTLRL